MMKLKSIWPLENLYLCQEVDHSDGGSGGGGRGGGGAGAPVVCAQAAWSPSRAPG